MIGEAKRVSRSRCKDGNFSLRDAMYFFRDDVSSVFTRDYCAREIVRLKDDRLVIYLGRLKKVFHLVILDNREVVLYEADSDKYFEVYVGYKNWEDLETDRNKGVIRNYSNILVERDKLEARYGMFESDLSRDAMELEMSRIEDERDFWKLEWLDTSDDVVKLPQWEEYVKAVLSSIEAVLERKVDEDARDVEYKYYYGKLNEALCSWEVKEFKI